MAKKKNKKEKERASIFNILANQCRLDHWWIVYIGSYANILQTITFSIANNYIFN
jgi:hypothetical protein